MRVNSPPTAANNQSLLEAIRQKEAAIARELAAAREAAVKELEEATEQARQIVAQAATDGRLAGEEARHTLLQEIEAETAAIITAAERQALALRNISNDDLQTAVNQAVRIIAPTGDEP